MAKSRESFNRREREKAKKAKADAKRQRRLNPPEASDPDEPPPAAVDQEAVINQLAELNAAYEAGNLEFEDFDERRAELLASLTIE